MRRVVSKRKQSSALLEVVYLKISMAHPRKRLKIYETKTHLFATLSFLILPFLFFLGLSELIHLPAASLFSDIFSSVWRMVIAYIIAAILGWILAVLLYKGKKAAIALPFFDVLQSFPTFAALPLTVYFLGASSLTIILFLIVTIIWPIFFSVISSLKLIQKDWEEAVEIEGLKGWNFLTLFLWPISIPGLITGTIIGLGDAWEAMIATEIIVGIKSSLGNFFDIYSKNTRITTFGILGFLLLIFSVNKLIWLPLLEWSHKRMEE